MAFLTFDIRHEMIDRRYGGVMQRKKETLKEENRGESEEEVDRDDKMQKKAEKVKKEMGNGGKER